MCDDDASSCVNTRIFLGRVGFFKVGSITGLDLREAHTESNYGLIRICTRTAPQKMPAGALKHPGIVYEGSAVVAGKWRQGKLMGDFEQIIFVCVAATESCFYDVNEHVHFPREFLQIRSHFKYGL